MNNTEFIQELKRGFQTTAQSSIHLETYVEFYHQKLKEYKPDGHKIALAQTRLLSFLLGDSPFYNDLHAEQTVRREEDLHYFSQKRILSGHDSQRYTTWDAIFRGLRKVKDSDTYMTYNKVLEELGQHAAVAKRFGRTLTLKDFGTKPSLKNYTHASDVNLLRAFLKEQRTVVDSKGGTVKLKPGEEWRLLYGKMANDSAGIDLCRLANRVRSRNKKGEPTYEEFLKEVFSDQTISSMYAYPQVNNPNLVQCTPGSPEYNERLEKAFSHPLVQQEFNKYQGPGYPLFRDRGVQLATLYCVVTQRNKSLDALIPADFFKTMLPNGRPAAMMFQYFKRTRNLTNNREAVKIIVRELGADITRLLISHES